MNPRITAPRGCNDILPDQSPRWQAIEAVARQTAALYHYSEIRTPIYESTQLFHRGVGETSDIVHKETFTFTDRGNESITLRPEQTAGVVRAVIENGLLNDPGSRVKVFYIGPNFRYERPQKGRLRQHHQFGVEAFGVAEPEQDVECILLQLDFYRRCGLKDLQLRVNSLGDRESKQRFSDHIRQTLSSNKSELSDDSQRRLDDNPLRILDSKDPRDQAATANLVGLGFLSDKSRTHLHRVQKLLDDAKVIYQVDGKLVRGFDYYTDTLWEVTAGGLGAQNAIGGGGRYDNLVEILGGKSTPGVGFGSGLERLLLALEAQNVAELPPSPPLFFLISQNDEARARNFHLLQKLRSAGFIADMDLTGRAVKSQFKLADREKAGYCLITGEQELKDNSVALKNLATGEQKTIAQQDLFATLNRLSTGMVV